MSTIPRRLVSSSSRLAQAQAQAQAQSSASAGFEVSTPKPIPAKYLPRVLHRQIAKRLNTIEAATGSLPATVDIPNPFVVQRGSKRIDSEVTGDARYHWKKPIISNRRQKQLLTWYPSEDLPASKKHTPMGMPAGSSRAVEWANGTIINWTGEIKTRSTTSDEADTVVAGEKKGVYAGRKKMFKGHKDERNRAQKEADREARLAGMEKRISDWRQGRTDEKIRNRPSLPF
ncbi:hypothetical protein I317_03212 [Kwoniella heveanensis CBS 569]|uniref:Large ribosomal subunit protein mL59 domain-containing protein n=1 Tax=Kwoniella heveanensis BCC8398 TaxID=1296120 RepID=A0A1B9GXD8_9TREE|nr:hypothetical protein I316_02743 [Kwoniella heveanensis BCC8398]OCF42991.1 hypothetical protein I317_03212 [Kwoniella heveanensis CBS 569]